MNHNFVGSYTTRYSKLTHLKFFRHAILAFLVPGLLA